MSLALAIALIVFTDLLIVVMLALVMAQARRLTPHVPATGIATSRK